MQILGVLSLHKGAGSATILVNLASGLVRQGKRVLIIELGPSLRLQDWLGITPESGLVLRPGFTLNDLQNRLVKAKFDLDVLTLAEFDGDKSALESALAILEQLEYDYLMINPGKEEACSMLPSDAQVLVCTDLQGENEVAEVQRLLAEPLGLDISLIIPNRIETKEWDHNSHQLTALGDHFGYEKLADPVPT